MPVKTPTHYHYACHACREPFLPYSDGLPCPKCATPARRSLPVARLVRQKIARREHGEITRLTEASCLFDRYALLARHARSSPESDHARRAARVLSAVDFGTKPYMRAHLQAFLEHYLSEADKAAEAARMRTEKRTARR